jgi:phosphohistidine phosphatase
MGRAGLAPVPAPLTLLRKSLGRRVDASSPLSGETLGVKRIHVLRHGKSGWDDSTVDDHDRPLASRGRKATAAIARYIEQSEIAPQLVLCSTALRARQTLEGITRALGADVAVEFEDDLYNASADDLIRQLRLIDERITSVLLIGHNPGLEDLVLRLASSGTDLERVREKFPSAALATVSFEGKWDDLEKSEASLVGYVTPKDLE